MTTVKPLVSDLTYEPLKLLIILGSKNLKQAGRNLIEEAKKFFDIVLAVPVNKIRIELKDGRTKVYYKNTDLTSFDACYARLFAEDFMIGEVILDLLEQSDVYIPGTVEGYQVSNHKYFTVKLLSKVGLPVPPTAFCASPRPATLITQKFSFPVVSKLLAGFGGKGVMLLQNEQEFKPLLETMDVLKEFIVTQEFVKNAGEDIRCYVMGDEVIAVKRFAAKGDWRSNVSRGGRAIEVEIPAEYREMAIKAAKTIGLDICSVDFIESDGKPYIIEVNYSPGMIIKFFDKKFAHIFVKYIYEKTKEHKMLV